MLKNVVTRSDTLADDILTDFKKSLLLKFNIYAFDISYFL